MFIEARVILNDTHKYIILYSDPQKEEKNIKQKC